MGIDADDESAMYEDSVTPAKCVMFFCFFCVS